MTRTEFVRKLRRGAISVRQFLSSLPFEFSEWQIRDIEDAVKGDVRIFIRTRRGGKTRDMTVIALYWALRGKRVIWFAPTADQLTQTKHYLLRSGWVSGFTREGAVKPFPYFYVAMLTKGKTAGKGADVLIYDELAKVEPHTKMYDFFLYSLAIASESSNGPLVYYGSTPAVGTAFEELVNGADPKSVRTHDYRECEWVDNEYIAELRRKFPSWYIEQEFECKFVARGGAVFSNIEVLTVRTEKLEGRYRVFTGVDFNGPKVGHYIVGCVVNGNDLYVLWEKIVNDITAIKKVSENTDMEIEAGPLFNVQFAEECRRLGVRAIYKNWDTETINRRVFALISFDHIYVDVERAPKTYEDLRVARWDENSRELKVKKRADQHGLDALLHAVHFTDLKPEVKFVGGEGKVYKHLFSLI